MSGAWHLPDEKRVALLMVNVSDQAIATDIDLDAAEYGISSDRVRVTAINRDGPGDSFSLPRRFHRELTIPPRTAIAWELGPQQKG